MLRTCGARNAIHACVAAHFAIFHRRSVCLLAGMCVLAGVGAFAQTNAVTTGVVLNGVNVVDTHTGKVTTGMAVAVDGGKISAIGRAGSLVARGSARRVQAQGKYIVPGFWEMHAHPIDSPDRVDSLTLMLANGITGFRQMSGSDAFLEQRREGTLMPKADAPELLAMPGSILLRGNAGTVPMAVAEVQKQKAEGADFIKTIDVTPPVFFAALEEATRQGLLYDGHLSPGVDAVKASEAGMRVIEHLGPMETLMISCSTDEAGIRAAMAQRAAAAAQKPAPPPATALNKAATSNPMLMRALADPGYLTRLQHVIDTYSDEKCRKVAAVFVAHNTWQVPTLIRLRTADFGDDPSYRDDPNLRYIAPATRQMWQSLAQQFSATMTPGDRETLKQFEALQLKMAKQFSDAGVKMLAGSDFGGIWLVAGFSLHQEFDLLAKAGFTPLQVLQMTTLDGAELLGRQATAGSVEVGKDANLVLLDGNPIESVQNLHKVNAVVRGGRYYSQEDLAALKQRVQDDIASRPQAKPAS